MAPVPASTARKSPVGKNRVLVTAPTSTAAPAPETEQTPSMARLTAVLAVCFSVGVAWPIVGGLQFVQRPPGSSAPKPPEPEQPDAPGDGEATPAVNPLVPAMRAAPLAMDPAQVENRVVESCESTAREAIARCDTPQLDRLLEAPLAQLAACGRARGTQGVFSLGMLVDFSSGKISAVKAGQSTTLSEEHTTTLLGCAEESVVGTALDGVEHAHARYWIYYVLRFGAPKAAPAASGAVVSASGQATVGWKTAIVRESPSSEASIVARLGYGTRIGVTGRAGDWYRIERAGKPLGWVHHEALGL